MVANLYMEFFENMALETAPSRPRHPQKGHRGRTPRPPEWDSTYHQIPFLDTLARRREDGGLDITAYRKPTHTDRYVSPLPILPSNTHEERLVKCLHDRARGMIGSQDSLQKKMDHLARVLRQNGYPISFIRSASAPPPQALDPRSLEEDQEEERKPPVMMILWL